MGQNLSLLNLLEQNRPQDQTRQRDSELTFDDIAMGLGTRFKNIVILCGAGISVNAGIPDFRSPGKGLYSRIAFGENLFTMSYFQSNPRPFYAFMRNFIKQSFAKAHPTKTHYFLRLLNDKGILTRIYTQNVDGLELEAGLPSEKVINAHGTFQTSHCISCRAKFDFTWLLTELSKSEDYIPTCPYCGNYVKPDVILFGEGTFPEALFTSQEVDFPKCDLVIVLGTSLVVQPFASLYYKANTSVPRLVVCKTPTAPALPPDEEKNRTNMHASETEKEKGKMGQSNSEGKGDAKDLSNNNNNNNTNPLTPSTSSSSLSLSFSRISSFIHSSIGWASSLFRDFRSLFHGDIAINWQLPLQMGSSFTSNLAAIFPFAAKFRDSMSDNTREREKNSGYALWRRNSTRNKNGNNRNGSRNAGNSLRSSSSSEFISSSSSPSNPAGKEKEIRNEVHTFPSPLLDQMRRERNNTMNNTPPQPPSPLPQSHNEFSLSNNNNSNNNSITTSDSNDNNSDNTLNNSNSSSSLTDNVNTISSSSSSSSLSPKKFPSSSNTLSESDNSTHKNNNTNIKSTTPQESPSLSRTLNNILRIILSWLLFFLSLFAPFWHKHNPFFPQNDMRAPEYLSFMYLSDCDEAVERICRVNGWNKELNSIAYINNRSIRNRRHNSDYSKGKYRRINNNNNKGSSNLIHSNSNSALNRNSMNIHNNNKSRNLRITNTNEENNNINNNETNNNQMEEEYDNEDYDDYDDIEESEYDDIRDYDEDNNNTVDIKDTTKTEQEIKEDIGTVKEKEKENSHLDNTNENITEYCNSNNSSIPVKSSSENSVPSTVIKEG